MASQDPFSAASTFEMSNGDAGDFADLHALESAGLCQLDKLPCTIRVLLEAALRKCDGFLVTEEDVKRIASWSPTQSPAEIPFMPSRVILQDFTGVPAVVDIAALRDAMVALGGDPKKVMVMEPPNEKNPFSSPLRTRDGKDSLYLTEPTQVAPISKEATRPNDSLSIKDK